MQRAEFEDGKTKTTLKVLGVLNKKELLLIRPYERRNGNELKKNNSYFNHKIFSFLSFLLFSTEIF